MPVRTVTQLPRVAPTARPQPFNNPAWLFEPKYDGFRGMLCLTRQSCTLYSKRGNAMTRFRDLAQQIRAELPKCEVILDGEIVALDDKGRISFWDLMRGRGHWPLPCSTCYGSIGVTSALYRWPGERSA